MYRLILCEYDTCIVVTIDGNRADRRTDEGAYEFSTLQEARSCWQAIADNMPMITGTVLCADGVVEELTHPDAHACFVARFAGLENLAHAEKRKSIWLMVVLVAVIGLLIGIALVQVQT